MDPGLAVGEANRLKQVLPLSEVVQSIENAGYQVGRNKLGSCAHPWRSSKIQLTCFFSHQAANRKGKFTVRWMNFYHLPTFRRRTGAKCSLKLPRVFTTRDKIYEQNESNLNQFVDSRH